MPDSPCRLCGARHHNPHYVFVRKRCLTVCPDCLSRAVEELQQRLAGESDAHPRAIPPLDEHDVEVEVISVEDGALSLPPTSRRRVKGRVVAVHKGQLRLFDDDFAITGAPT